MVASIATALVVTGQQGQRAAELFGMPNRLTGSNDWKKLAPLPLTAQTEVMLAWLVEERREPTPTYKGLGGGPIDTDYTQAQIVHSLASGDPRVLRWLVRSDRVRSSEMKAILGLALAMSGDKTAKPHILKALSSNKNPWLREKAATFLGEWPDDETVEALKAALDDPYHIQFERTLDTVEVVDKYPVREAAEHTLDVIARGLKPNEWSSKWLEKYEQAMQDYDSFVSGRAGDLDRILAIVNREGSR